jgi:hypothetical protein
MSGGRSVGAGAALIGLPPLVCGCEFCGGDGAADQLFDRTDADAHPRLPGAIERTRMHHLSDSLRATTTKDRSDIRTDGWCGQKLGP